MIILSNIIICLYILITYLPCVRVLYVRVRVCTIRENLMPLQFWITLVLALGMLETTVLFGKYLNWNDYGSPAMAVTFVALIFGVLKVSIVCCVVCSVTQARCHLCLNSSVPRWLEVRRKISLVMMFLFHSMIVCMFECVCVRVIFVCVCLFGCAVTFNCDSIVRQIESHKIDYYAHKKNFFKLILTFLFYRT